MNTHAQQLKIDPTEYREKIGDALYRGDLSGLSDTERQHALKMSELFNHMADDIETFHADFPDLDISKVTIQRKLVGKDRLYFPHYTVDPVEYVSRMKRFLQQFDSREMDLLPEMAAKFGSKTEITDKTRAAHDAIAALEGWWGKPIRDLSDLRGALTSVSSFQRSSEFGSVIRGKSLFEREDNIPEFLINKDVTTAAMGWAQNMYRYVALRNPLDQLKQQAGPLENYSPVLGKYIKDYTLDLSGGRSGTWAAKTQETFDRVKIFAADHAAATKNPMAKAYWNAIGNMDNTLRRASGNMYSYFLGVGASIDSTVRNVPQIFMMTTPAITPNTPQGMLYSYKKTITGQVVAVKLMKNKQYLEEMRRLGQLPDEQAFEAMRYLTDGIKEAGTPIGKVRGALEAVSRASMVFYRGADTYSRAGTRVAALSVIQDAMNKHPQALEAIYNTPIGYRSALTEALASGQQKKAEQLYTDYLLGKTQFNYNRASMSEFGRYMGWMFSMFSKWPTAAVGDIGSAVDKWAMGMSEEKKREMTMLGVKYLMPFLVAQAAQSGYYEDLLDEQPELQAVFGKDLVKFTPMDTPKQIVTALTKGQSPVGKIPWALDIPARTAAGGIATLSKAASGDLDAAKKEFNRLTGLLFENAMSLTPGGIIAKSAAYWYGQEVLDTPLKVRDIPAYLIDDEIPNKK